MAALQNLQELQDWQKYRTFSKERLKTLAPEGEPIFVSREDVDFDLKGKPWSGRAFLVGRKGEMAAKQMKKEGCLFREGTCRVEGQQLVVEGLPAALVKRVQKTCRKLVLGYEIVGAEAGEGDPEEEEMPLATAGGRSDGEEGAVQLDEEEESGPAAAKSARGASTENGAIQLDEEEEAPSKASSQDTGAGRDRRKAELERELGKLAPKIREAAAAAPEKRRELQLLVQAQKKLVEEGRYDPAEKALGRLQELTDTVTAGKAGSGGAARSAEAGDKPDPDAESSPAARGYRRRSPDLFERLSKAVGEGGDAARTRLLQAAAHRAEDARQYAGGKRFDKANAALDDVEKVVLRLESTEGTGRRAG